jgi:hypothetical protein
MAATPAHTKLPNDEQLQAAEMQQFSTALHQRQANI